MNVEIGAEAAQFPEKEYINGIVVAVYLEELLRTGLLDPDLAKESGSWEIRLSAGILEHSAVDRNRAGIVVVVPGPPSYIAWLATSWFLLGSFLFPIDCFKIPAQTSWNIYHR
jgi:hypothetical protein